MRRRDVEKAQRVWAQRISDGALRALGIPPEPIPWIKPQKRPRHGATRV